MPVKTVTFQLSVTYTPPVIILPHLWSTNFILLLHIFSHCSTGTGDQNQSHLHYFTKWWYERDNQMPCCV